MINALVELRVELLEWSLEKFACRSFAHSMRESQRFSGLTAAKGRKSVLFLRVCL